jgi:hypothetical protein
MRISPASGGGDPEIPGVDRPAECPCCGEALDLMQPDPRHGELLLGVCTGCPSWTLIDARDGSVVDLIAVRLPRRSRGPIRLERPSPAPPRPRRLPDPEPTLHLPRPRDRSRSAAN